MPAPALHFPVRVPDDLLLALGEHTGVFWSDSLGMAPFVCEAIRNYINPPPPPPQQPAGPSEAGYQWKEVFLPEGTRLRASFGRQQYFATVEGAEIKYGKHAVSPSCFANLQGSGNRNAWKAIWLRLPGSDAWLLANVCRAARKAEIARLLADEAQEDRPRTRAARQPAERPSGQRPPGVRPLSGPVAPPGNGMQPKNGSGRGARRRKRPATKQVQGNS